MKQTDQADQDELRPEYTPADFEGAVRGKCAGMLPAHRLTFALNCERQENGRWRANVDSFPGATAHADSQEGDIDIAETLVFTVIADQVERGEIPPTALFFVISDCSAAPRPASNSR